MALCGEVNDDIIFGDEFVHELMIADITGDKVDPVEYRGEVVGIARVGQFVDDGDLIFGPIFERVVYKV